MTNYYLSPESWSSDSYRDVYTLRDIKSLPEDWNADEDDCEFLGEFHRRSTAINYARKNYSGVRP
jgi:hypothetical protein